MKPQRPEVQPPIAAAIIVHNDRVLLVRRRVGEGSLLWQFPAGAVEPGETPEAAAVRETAEEVGVVVQATRRLGERIHPSTGRSMVYVSCEFVSGAPYIADGDELADVTWSTLSDLSGYVPAGLFQPVQAYLDRVLTAA
jgi:8-oxo-dGTP diphosphatase